MFDHYVNTTQLTFTSSKATLEKLEKGVKFVFKGNNKDTRTTSWRRSGVFIVNLHHISDIFLVFLLLALNKEMPAVKAL